MITADEASIRKTTDPPWKMRRHVFNAPTTCYMRSPLMRLKRIGRHVRDRALDGRYLESVYHELEAAPWRKVSFLF